MTCVIIISDIIIITAIAAFVISVIVTVNNTKNLG